MSIPHQSDLIASKSQVQEYTLEGGVIFRDKTNKTAKVIYCKKMSDVYGDPAYKITLKGKILIFPTATSPSDNEFVLIGSKRITIKPKDDFYKITEVDALGKSVFYVDSSKTVKGKAFDTYNEFPKEINLEEAKSKFSHLKEQCPAFKPLITAFNRHGVGVFGRDEKENEFAFYWASPSKEKVERMDCSRLEHFGNEYSTHVKTQNGFVNFLYNPALKFLDTKENCFINAEPATIIH